MKSLLQIYDLNAVNVVIKPGWNDFIFIDFVSDYAPAQSTRWVQVQSAMHLGRGKKESFHDSRKTQDNVISIDFPL
jgi:hypothetical protein